MTIACGERMAVGGTTLIGALIQRRETSFDGKVHGALAIVDTASGRVKRTLRLPALPEDVVVSP